MFTEIFHYVGGFIKYLGATAILVLSISLSFAMFTSIAPPDMPWFPWAALGLTDGGFIGWLVVFRMIKYHGPHKSVAFVMIWVCLAAALFTDAMELAHMFHIAPLFAGMYYYALIALLLAHFLALAIDELISEGQKYSQQQYHNPRYTIEQQTRNLAETNVREERPQPKEERILEQRAQSRRSADCAGPGFWQNVTELFRRHVGAGEPAQPQGKTQEEMDDWLAEQQIRQERQIEEEKQRKEAARQRVLARQSSPVQQSTSRNIILDVHDGEDELPVEDDDDRPVSVVIKPSVPIDDRKAQSERTAKQQKQSKK